MSERAESDMREYGQDYDLRLSVRVHERHIERADIMAEAVGRSRAEFIRDLIDNAYRAYERKLK